MMRLAKKIYWLIFLSLLLLTISIRLEAVEEEWADSYSNPNQQQTIPYSDLQNLRLFHEGMLFITKRYATMEALLTAIDQKHIENEAFLIGAASLIPGAGQMINYDYLEGSLLLGISSISWMTIQQLSFTRQTKKEAESLLPWYYFALVARNGIITYAMLHACNAHYQQHKDRTAAMWTGAASLLPGVGQGINGDWWEALGLFTGWTLATLLTINLEDQIYLNGDESYLVQRQKFWLDIVSGLSGKMIFTFNTEW